MFDAVIRLALARVGIAQVPDALGFTAVVAGELVPVLATQVALAPPLVLVYPGNRYLTAKVRVFSDFFAAEFPKEGWWPKIQATTQATNTSTDAVAGALTGT